VRYRSVVFDCDSTLSAIEGIDELARDHRDQIAALAARAMAGQLALEQVYGRRLELIRPTRSAVIEVGRQYVSAMVPGADQVVRALQQGGVTVQVLSGGIAPAVRILTDRLGIPDDRVAAVELHFDAEGAYAGFDADSPLTRSGGKREWIERHRARLPGPVLLVGDGTTDLEARPVVDTFAAFAGVVRRDPVVARADVVLPGPGLEQVLTLVFGGP